MPTEIFLSDAWSRGISDGDCDAAVASACGPKSAPKTRFSIVSFKGNAFHFTAAKSTCE